MKQTSWWWIQSTFLISSLALLTNLPQTLMYEAGADASSWLEPAKALLKHLDFVYYDEPSVSNIYRPPVVPLFNAFFLWIGQENGVRAIVIAQIFVFSLTSIVVAHISEQIQKGTGAIAMSLFLINPNALGIIFLIQSETVFCFLLTCSAYFLFNFIKSNSWRHIIGCGCFLALTTLTRPTTQYLIVLLPLICFFLIFLSGARSRVLFLSIGKGIVASIVAAIIILPWAMKVQKVEGYLSLTSSEIRSLYIFDQLHYFNSYGSEISISEMNQELSRSPSQKLRLECDKMVQNSENHVACYRELIKLDTENLLNQPFQNYVKPFFNSMAHFFISGGSGKWHNLLLKDQKYLMFESWINIEQDEGISKIIKLCSSLSFAAILITGVCIVFSITIKVLSLIGIFGLIKRRNYAALGIFMGIILYFTATTLFLGTSRYRIPLEPYFVTFSVIGCSFLWQIFVKKEEDHN